MGSCSEKLLIKQLQALNVELMTAGLSQVNGLPPQLPHYALHPRMACFIHLMPFHDDTENRTGVTYERQRNPCAVQI